MPQAKRCTFVIPNDAQPIAELNILCLTYPAIAVKTGMKMISE
jgi:hypothetical protein